jgi:hypothetical protein
MQQQDQSTAAERPADQEDMPMPSPHGPEERPATTGARQSRRPLDWPALMAALAVAAFFALTARFNSQPSPSYIPAAVLSATGCGLLVTAVRLLRQRAGIGLREAGLAGGAMALCQFAITLTYPAVPATVLTSLQYGRAFLLTWGLVALLSTLLSLAGAALAYLVFAAPSSRSAKSEEVGEEQETEDADEADDGQQESALQDTGRPQGAWAGYGPLLILFALLPMLAGYVFAAAYDFAMQGLRITQISPALYPTLSLLSGLLPWRLAAPITLSSANGSFIVFTLLWRIPDSALGNPNLFDVQAMEPYVFTAAGLALLFIARHPREHWGKLLLLETLLGLLLVLPANLWMLRGLQGVLQFGNTVVSLPTIHLLNLPLFLLNVLTGALFCVLVGLIVRRQYQLWTMPRPVPPSANLQE